MVRSVVRQEERGDLIGKPWGIIYVITHVASDKQYVGQTRQGLERRWSLHVRDSRTEKKRPKMPVLGAIYKYGPDAFEIKQVAECWSQEELDAAEKQWATDLSTFAPTGYNLRAGNGPGSVSDESRQRLRDAMTPERREHLRQLHKGKPLSDQARANARRALMRPMTLLSPDGTETYIENSVEFAKANGLQYSLLRAVFVGSRLSHKGWRLTPEIEVSAEVRVLDTGHYHCPVCKKTWATRSHRQAQLHVTSCARLDHAKRVALERGNITPAQYDAATAYRNQKPPQQRSRRLSPDARWRQVTTFTVAHADGTVVHWGNKVRRFADEYALDHRAVSSLLHGKKAAYRGWTVVSVSFE